MIKSLKIDHYAFELNDEIDFEEYNIYKEPCGSYWHYANGGKSLFYWQVNDKGTQLIISGNTLPEYIPSGSADSLAKINNHNYNGTYQLQKLYKKKRLRIASYNTRKYNGTRVEYELWPE